MKFNKLFWLLAMSAVLAGCASRGHRAPIIERGESIQHPVVSPAQTTPGQAPQHVRERDWRPDSITVKKGDTLYSIAFNFGFDYHELAELNSIKDPTVISVGQVIRLFPGRPTSLPAEIGKPVEPPIKDQPKLVKYPYSEAAVALIEKGPQGYPETETVVKTEIVPKTEIKPMIQPGNAGTDDDEEPALDWAMPANGKLLAKFSESANRKGIDIGGKLGQPVFASAPGKVVYSGSGLRGYGKLIIIKHNNTFLSAYAHNDKILVKEGQSITRGQKIAEMGRTDTDQIKLHFEVRRLGKPVDPAKYLPLGKS